LWIKLTMEGSRLYSSSFKNHAFIWKEMFNQRQTKVYPRENSTHMPNRNLEYDTEEITERFVNNECMDDVDRHLSRALQVGNFISSANIDTLRGPPSATVSEPMVLIDDRNNETVTRAHLTGNCRPSRGPLNAHQLYAELTQQVRLLHIHSQLLHAPLHISGSFLLPTITGDVRDDASMCYVSSNLLLEFSLS
jgi:hypothetical protein